MGNKLKTPDAYLASFHQAVMEGGGIVVRMMRCQVKEGKREWRGVAWKAMQNEFRQFVLALRMDATHPLHSVAMTNRFRLTQAPTADAMEWVMQVALVPIPKDALPTTRSTRAHVKAFYAARRRPPAATKGAPK